MTERDRFTTPHLYGPGCNCSDKRSPDGEATSPSLISQLHDTNARHLTRLTQQINEARRGEGLTPMRQAEVMHEVLLSFTLSRNQAVTDAKRNLALATLSRRLDIKRT